MKRRNLWEVEEFLIIFLLTLALIAAGIYILTRKPKPEPPEGYHYVLYVIDGDTIIIDYHGQREFIRLLRINTPEREQYGYSQAKRAMIRLVGRKRIRLEFEPAGRVRRDKYKRILAYVWVDDLNVNIEMVRLGWSRFWARYEAGKYAGEFRAAEREARENKRGLWKRR